MNRYNKALQFLPYILELKENKNESTLNKPSNGEKPLV